MKQTNQNPSILAAEEEILQLHEIHLYFHKK
jgi:hypothetical protein